MTDSTFLQNILRRYEKDDNLKIHSVEESPGSEKGDNYMSVVTRLSVTGIMGNGEQFRRRLIAKRVPENAYCQEVFRSNDLFENEAAMYRALPELFGKKPKNFANYLYADRELIVMEDLKSQGFFMADRVKGLDFDHTKLVLEALAELHAASFLLHYSDAEKFSRIRQDIKEMIFPDCEEIGMGSFINDIPKFIILCLKAAGDNNAKEIDFMEAHNGQVYDIMKDLVKPKKYSVLCAGDCWTNNLLFRYDTKNEVKIVTDVKLLDFQIARYSSVATDLLYFFHSSLQHSLLLTHLDTFLEVYLSKLVSTLATLSKEVLKDLSMDWLKEEMITHQLYGLFTSLWLAAAVTMDAKHAPDGDALASQTVERDVAIEYWKDKLSPDLLQRVQDKCKYFIA